MKSTVEEIQQRFDAGVKRFANLETGQSAQEWRDVFAGFHVEEAVGKAAAKVAPAVALHQPVIEQLQNRIRELEAQLAQRPAHDYRPLPA